MFKISSKISYFSLLLLTVPVLLGGNLRGITMMLVALALHELSHWLALQLFEYQALEFKLTPLGGEFLVDSLLSVDPKAEFFIAASGPLINWIMVGAVFYLHHLGLDNSFLVGWQQCNYLIGFINLIPVAPLDGWRMLHAWLTQHFGAAGALQGSKIVSIISSFGLLGMGLLKFSGQRGGSLFMLIGLFALYQVWFVKPPQAGLYWKMLQRKKRLLAQRGCLGIKSIVVTPQTLLRKALDYHAANEYLQFTVYSKGKIVEILGEEQVWEVLATAGAEAKFSEAGVTCTN